MPEFSIIVPIYKVEKYLEICIDSIIGQSFCDFELILVDDGSPDTCGEICDRYSSSDTRVKVVHKENGGLSSARNAGLDIATGKYVIFIDSDDFGMMLVLLSTFTLTLQKRMLTYLYSLQRDTMRAKINILISSPQTWTGRRL